MKTMIFAGVVALAMTTLAQGTQPTAAPAATTAQAVKAEMKKAVAKTKKAKKTMKQKAKLAPVAMPAMQAAAPVAAPAVEAAPAAATSVAATPAPAAPTKKWGASVTINPSSDFASPTKVGALTTFGGSYKVTDAWKASLKTTFESVAIDGYEDNAVVNHRDNNFRSAYTDVGVSTSLPAMLGSDAISLGVSLRKVSRDSIVSRTTLGKVNGHLNVDISMPFTITPKLSASVYGNYRHFDVSDDGQDRAIIQPSVAYAINDVVSVYQAAGYMKSTQKAFRLENRRERILLETGVDLSPMKGLSVNLNINQDKGVSSGVGEVITNFDVYKPNNVSKEQAAAGLSTLDAVAYEAVVSYSF